MRTRISLLAGFQDCHVIVLLSLTVDIPWGGVQISESFDRSR